MSNHHQTLATPDRGSRRAMRRRAGATGACAVLIGLVAAPATAEQRTITVTLLGGKTITLPIEVPPGTPLDKIQLPGIDTPVVAISTGRAPAPAPEHAAAEHHAKPKRPPARKRAKDAQRTVRQVVQQVAAPVRPKKRALNLPSAAPKRTNPTFSLALPGPAPIGVPNFFIDRFRIPPFLLPIYQAAGVQYGVRWEVLAAINEIETDYGRNLAVSSAGARGWMQFIPSSWRRYGVDANADGVKDPYNPVDAIFSAARYLRAANAEKDLRGAIFAYNHADWYVDSVLLRARVIGGLPADLVGSLTGLTQGRFPVHSRATYVDQLSRRDVRRRANGPNAAKLVHSTPGRRGITIFARAGAPVIAVQDGKIVRIGRTPRLGRFIQLRDAYGNTYTYAHLKKIARTYAVPRRSRPGVRGQALPARDPRPTAPASAGTKRRRAGARVDRRVRVTKERLFANRPRTQVAGRLSRYTVTGNAPAATRSDLQLRRLRRGSRVAAGTVLGRIGRLSAHSVSHLLFEIRPAGRGAPRIDPKPILDGWKLLESTAIYRAAGKNPFFGRDAKAPSIGQILLMSKETLIRRVLANRNIDVYGCGRRDIRAGIVDRRVLATLEFLAAGGLNPTVTSLRCGHGYFTKSGNVSEHSFGSAVDISAINGIPILRHQGPGSVADVAVRRLLTLQGPMQPHQIISLMTYSGAPNTFAMADHADHLHIGFRPLYGSNTKLGRRLAAVLKPSQWIKLIDRVSTIDNPTVLLKPSRFATKVSG